MKTYDVKELKAPSYFSEDVYVDKKFLFSSKNGAVTEKLKEFLTEWGFNTVYSEGVIIPQSLHNMKNKNENRVGSAMGDVSRVMENLKRQQKLMEDVEKKFVSLLAFLNKIYSEYSDEKRIDVRGISDKAKELYELIKENKNMVLRIKTEKYKDGKNYVVMHSLRSTVFAIIIGIQIKMPVHRIIELATSCLLHEIGMVKLPPKMYMENTLLNEQEKMLLKTHPIVSYQIVKNASFSLPICLAVLEHHERENGTGYPRRLSSGRISLYGKIIAVVCSFEAATAERPYKEAKNAAAGIFDMMKNTDKQYDETILKALLYSISFYPIGVYIKLSNGKIAQVVDVNPYDPRFPIVQIYGEVNQNGEPKIMGTSAEGITVKRILTKQEMDELNSSST